MALKHASKAVFDRRSAFDGRTDERLPCKVNDRDEGQVNKANCGVGDRQRLKSTNVRHFLRSRRAKRISEPCDIHGLEKQLLRKATHSNSKRGGFMRGILEFEAHPR
eukprot:6030111-Pleurochrysis_carterae.AAC.2